MRLNPLCAVACGAALALATGVPAAPALAGTLQVNPILVQIDPSRRTATVTVRNAEAAPVTIRAYPLAWRQAQGDDVYEDTSALIVSPPIFTIPPGGTQLVRVGLRSPSATPQSFRLMIEEVPEANPEGGIRVALRLNLPFYVSMPAGEPGDLRWNVARSGDGGWTVEAANPGRGYVRLDRSAVQGATGLSFADTVNFGTVLPGATRRWQLPAAAVTGGQAQFQHNAGTDRRDSAATGRP